MSFPARITVTIYSHQAALFAMCPIAAKNGPTGVGLSRETAARVAEHLWDGGSKPGPQGPEQHVPQHGAPGSAPGWRWQGILPAAGQQRPQSAQRLRENCG